MTNKTWLITGTSRGFGKELALLVAKNPNLNLAATARNLNDLSYLDEFNQEKILKLKVDMANQDDIKKAVSKTFDKFGRIDVLENNAGFGYFSTFEEAEEKIVRNMFEVNVWGLIEMTQAVLPIMRKQQSGVISSISSMAGIVGIPGLSFYNGTKFAVEGIMASLSKELVEDNIKVMTVEPSSFRTDWSGSSSQSVATKFPDNYKAANQTITAGKSATGSEPGDPKKAAAIIFDQIENNFDKLPTQLPLGKAAGQYIPATLKQETANFEKLADLAASADF